MRKSLDDRYGRTSKLVENIIYNIKRAKPIKEDKEKKFVAFVDLVETAHYLAHRKVEHELSNATVISWFEEKLPKKIRRDCSKMINEKGNKIDDANRFPAFLDLLLQQKGIIEYEAEDIEMKKLELLELCFHLHNEEEEKIKEPDYSGNFPRCLVHNSNTHTTSNCQVYTEKSSE